MPQRLVVVEHPVLADRLTVLRDRETGFADFRQALFEASAILAVEAARELPVSEVPIETPLDPDQMVLAFRRWDEEVGAAKRK